MKYGLNIKNLNGEVSIEDMSIHDILVNFLVRDYGYLGELVLPDFSSEKMKDTQIIGVYSDGMVMPRQELHKLVFANKFKKVIEQDDIGRPKLINATITIQTKDRRK